jgi:hexosaminidase
LFLAVLLGLALRSGAAAQAAGGSPAPAPTLVPRPVHVTPKPGSFTLTGATVITADAATRALGAMLADYLFPATGFRIGVRSTAPAGAAGISIRLDATLTSLGAEGYRLEAAPSGGAIRAARPAGAFYASQTLR